MKETAAGEQKKDTQKEGSQTNPSPHQKTAQGTTKTRNGERTFGGHLNVVDHISVTTHG